MREDGTTGSTGGSGSGMGGGAGFGRGGKFFDDIAGAASGAFSVLTGLRAEGEAMARAQAEAMIARLELVRREELDAALEVARRAREEVEALTTRVAALEARAESGADGEDPVAAVAGEGPEAESGAATDGAAGGDVGP